MSRAMTFPLSSANTTGTRTIYSVLISVLIWRNISYQKNYF